MSRLSLAIPVFNGTTYLASTLNSLAVNRPFVRWWLQDGDSSDGTADLARSFVSSADTVVSETDSGQVDALNRALTKMGGDIVGFLNADDLLAEGAAEAVVEYFNAHPEVDIVCGQVDWIDANGQITGRHSGNINTLEDVLDIYQVWWAERQWVQPEVFFRRSLWEAAGPFDPRYDLAFDFDFWVRCFKRGARVGYLPMVLARFRRHDAQKSRLADKASREIREIVERNLDAPISRTLRRSLRRRLEYDRYRLKEGPYAANALGFLRYLTRHPTALCLPEVRGRIAASLRARTEREKP